MTNETKTQNDNQQGAKEKIVGAAIREFSENGMAGARVDQIATEAGVNKALIYYHFSSKENLYRESIKTLLATRLESLRRNLESLPTLEGALKQTLDLHSDLFLDQPEVARILLRELADPKSESVANIANIIQQSNLPVELSKRITDGVSRGECRPVNVRQTIISLVTMSIGYYLLAPMFEKIWRIGHQPTFVDERKEAILDLFMNGVKAR
jgi:TetR/AcrR family transcriptional regulator